MDGPGPGNQASLGTCSMLALLCWERPQDGQGAAGPASASQLTAQQLRERCTPRHSLTEESPGERHRCHAEPGVRVTCIGLNPPFNNGARKQQETERKPMEQLTDQQEGIGYNMHPKCTQLQSAAALL